MSKSRVIFLIVAVILLSGIAVPGAIPALAADSGWKAPSLSLPIDCNGFTNPNNAFSSDDSYVTVSVKEKMS